MTAAERVLPLLSNLRSRGDDRWIARCPAHKDRSPSLSVRQTQDRLLLRCWAGCATSEILNALGLDWSALFADGGPARRPNAVVEPKVRAGQSLETWRQAELKFCGEELRRRDMLRIAVTDAVYDGTLSEEGASHYLAAVYRGYSELENRWHRLLHVDQCSDTLSLWRESGKGAA